MYFESRDNRLRFPVSSPDTHNNKVVPLMRRRILLVEDEEDIAELVALHLADVCDEVVVARDGHEGMRLATTMDWALIVLDLRLPGRTACRFAAPCDANARTSRYSW